jgi:hypothetical protein
MGDRSSVGCKATANDSAVGLCEEFIPDLLSQKQLKLQIALYIEAAALKPLLSSGVALEQVAEALIELAVQGVQQSSGRVAAAVMLQRATRHAFASAVAVGMADP